MSRCRIQEIPIFRLLTGIHLTAHIGQTGLIPGKITLWATTGFAFNWPKKSALEPTTKVTHEQTIRRGILKFVQTLQSPYANQTARTLRSTERATATLTDS